MRVRFKGYATFGGTVRGIFKAENDRQSAMLLAFASDRTTGVTEISEGDYERMKNAALPSLLDQSLELLGGVEEWWHVKDYPGFVEQTPWPSNLFWLPPSYMAADFNCSALEFDGQRFLVTRKSERNSSGLLDSSLVVYPMNLEQRLGTPIRIRLPRQSGSEQFEDPRAFVHDNQIFISYCHWDRSFYLPRQILARLNDSFEFVESWKVPFGHNGSTTHGQEKNWVWFKGGNKRHLVYAFNPHTVVEMEDHHPGLVHKTALEIVPWKYGEIRGGTNPVKVGGEYFSFFHSSLPWTGRQRRYFMGAYAFNASPPFAVTRMSVEPILAGSDRDTRILQMPLVVFPCGALFKKEEWLVTFGVNDEACGWIRVPHDGLIQTMRKVP